MIGMDRDFCVLMQVATGRHHWNWQDGLYGGLGTEVVAWGKEGGVLRFWCIL